MGDPPTWFSGILVRASVADGSIDLFFHPWRFEADVTARPVLVARLNHPALPAADIETLLDQGVDAEFHPDRIDIWREEDGTEVELKADSINLSWQAYGIEDYADYVRKLEARYGEENQSLSRSRRRIADAVKLAQELIRRAEAKGQLSSEMDARQAEAIRVLERMIDALEETP